MSGAAFFTSGVGLISIKSIKHRGKLSYNICEMKKLFIELVITVLTHPNESVFFMWETFSF